MENLTYPALSFYNGNKFINSLQDLNTLKNQIIQYYNQIRFVVYSKSKLD